MAQYFQMECYPFGKIVKVIGYNEEIQNIDSDSLLLIFTTTGNYFMMALLDNIIEELKNVR